VIQKYIDKDSLHKLPELFKRDKIIMEKKANRRKNKFGFDNLVEIADVRFQREFSEDLSKSCFNSLDE